MKGTKMGKSSSYLANYIWPVVDKKYRTRSDAADDLGIDQAVLSRICSGKWFGISEHLVENICTRLSLDPAEGLLRLFLSKNSKIKQHFLSLTKATSVEIVPTEKHEQAGTTGKSSEEYIPISFLSSGNLPDNKTRGKKEKGDYILIQKSLLPKNGLFSAHKVKDENMLPTLPVDTVIIVDTKNTQAVQNNVFLFKHKNQIKIGRAFIQDSFVQMCPDNFNRNKFQSYVFDLEKGKSKKENPILGKVVLAYKKF